MAYTRPYNNKVNVGNWVEDRNLEEEALKEFIVNRESGTLNCQKNSITFKKALSPVELNIAHSGYVPYGKIINIFNKNRGVVLSANIWSLSNSNLLDSSPVTASQKVETCSRNSFQICPLKSGEFDPVLKYGVPFLVKLVDVDMYLFSDVPTIQNTASAKSRHSPIYLRESELTYRNAWKVVPLDPQMRFELEFTPVSANRPLVMLHCMTNMALNVEEVTTRTTFGKDYEVSAHTCLDTHKCEKETNHWMFLMKVPGDDIKPV